MLADRDDFIKSVDTRSRIWLVKIATHPWTAIALLALLTIVSYLPSVARIPAVDRTEPLIAVVSRDLVVSQDILRPSYRGTLQITRSAGTFWLQGLVAAAAGEKAQHTIAIYRLPSLAATTLAVILTFLLARPLLGPVAAFIASVIVAVCPIVALHAHLAIAEPLVLPCIICALLMALRLYVTPPTSTWEQRQLSAVFWIALGISTWFNALAVPLLSFVILATLAICDRNLHLVRRLEPWFGLPLMGIIAVPWLVALSAKSGGWPLADLGFWDVLEILEGGQAEKIEFVPGSYVLTVAIGFVPIAYLLGPVLQGYWHQRHDRLVRFCLVWFLAPIGALELLSNEPPLYTVQSVLPAAAILVALAVAPGQHRQLTLLKPWRSASFAAMALAAIAGPLIFAALLYITATPLKIGHVAGYGLVMLLFVLATQAATRGWMSAWLTFGCAGAWTLNVWFFAFLMPGLQNFWTAPQLEQVVSKVETCKPGTQVDIIGFREPSTIFTLGDRAVTRSTPSARQQEDAVTIVEQNDEAAFLASNPRSLSLGCFKSFNIARPTALTFKVFAAPGVSALSSCQLGLQDVCAANLNLVR